MKNTKKAWILSVVLIVVLVSALFFGLIVALIPQIVKNITSFAEILPQYVADLKEQFSEMDGAGILHTLMEEYLVFDEEAVSGDSVMDFVAGNADLLLAKTRNIGSAAVRWLMGVVFAIYFILNKEQIIDVILNFLSLTVSSLNRVRMKIVLGRFNSIFSKFIISELVDALIIGGLCYVFMLLTKMPEALLISAVVGITNLVPTFGPIAGAAVGAFILMVMKPSSILFFLLFIAVIQMSDGYLIKPKLMGNVLDVPGILIIIATVVFGNLMGIVGMLLAIPLAAILTYCYNKLLIPWLELKRDLKEYKKDMERS